MAKDLCYLRILHLAAATSEADVEAALCVTLDAREVPEVDAIKALTGATRTPLSAPAMAALEADLGAYDALLEAGGQP